MTKKAKSSTGTGKKAAVKKKTSIAKSVKAKPKTKTGTKTVSKAAMKPSDKSKPKAKAVRTTGAGESVPARRVLSEGIMMAREGMVQEAIDLLLDLHESAPEFNELYPVLCELYIKAGRMDIPSVWVSKAVAHEPKLETEFIDLATELYDDGLLNEAASILGGLVDAGSSNFKVWNNYSIVLYTLASYLMEESERCIIQGLSLCGDNPEAIQNAVKISEIRKTMALMLPEKER